MRAGLVSCSVAGTVTGADETRKLSKWLTHSAGSPTRAGQLFLSHVSLKGLSVGTCRPPSLVAEGCVGGQAVGGPSPPPPCPSAMSLEDTGPHCAEHCLSTLKSCFLQHFQRSPAGWLVEKIVPFIAAKHLRSLCPLSLTLRRREMISEGTELGGER